MPIDTTAVSRVITKAVALYNAVNTIRHHNTGRSADYVAEKVKERVTAQSKSWRMDFADASKATKRLKTAEAERIKRVALLMAAIEKQPDNETLCESLVAAMTVSEPS
ncbi:hypothetical protein I4F81_009689 [Pyropia yezoensis]|uniref:Uncharacterized protein n=1 Tax=Pyropia yezoensis TaxID=2788 RepID=A0ACC3CAG4_PYRYE|nr:hypothetical protein I4F81_009689 [Neopyropia yezoensis]